MTRSQMAAAGPARTEPVSEIDLAALGRAIARRKRVVAIPTLLAFVLMVGFVLAVTPRYTAQSQVLLENQETFFTRPDRINLPPDQASQVDQEAVASQVQLIGSRDLARRAIKELRLIGNPEFDPLAQRGVLTRVLVLLGLAHDPSRASLDARMTTAFGERLTVFSPPKTRVIAIEFTSKDPSLAADGANMVADLYLREQSAAKRATAQQAADALAAQIADLRAKLADADGRLEQYRLQSGLLAGGNNMTISGQQLADINADLSKARSVQADARAKASILHDLLRSGTSADVTDAVSNESVRRIADQRVLAQAQLAEAARTLLPNHPRMKELAAQVAQYDTSLKAAAKQAAAALDTDARIAGVRVSNLEAVLATQKQAVGLANTDEVRLHAFERGAQSLKDQLASSTTKYQEALARQSSTATPADARVISRATPPQEPSYPKKLPFIAFASVAAFVFALGYVIAGELLSGAVTIADAGAPALAPPVLDAAPQAAPAVRPLAPRFGDDPASFAAARPDPREAGASPPRPPLVATARHALLTALAYLKAFGQSAEASRTEAAIGFDPSAPRREVGRGGVSAGSAAAAPVDPSPEAFDVTALADRIVAAHRPGHGLHVVATSLRDEPRATAILVDLARALSGRGRSIIADLNRTPARLAAMAAGGEGPAAIAAMEGLSELLAGDSSFAEVIHRDHASRLHFIPSGKRDADFRDFDLVLDALGETYDFIILVAPAFPQGEIAKVMAPYADFVVLIAPEDPGGVVLDVLRGELMEAGAQEVLVAGPPVPLGRPLREVA